MMSLFVPFEEKDEAKALGARWNKESSKWFVPDGVDVSPFSKWLQPRSKALLPIEQRGMIYVDLVPRTAWFSNLRSEISPAEWEIVKKKTFLAAHYRCEVCGGSGTKHPVECHERWSFDEVKGIQTLERVIALCPACHQVTHFGFAQISGKEEQALKHLMRVNEWSEEQANEHIGQAFKDWERRNSKQWRLDARWLLSYVDLTSETIQKIHQHFKGEIKR